MKIERSTAQAIFCRPADLEIKIRERRPSGKCEVDISRGPRGHFKHLLTSEPLDTTESAVETAERALRSAQDMCKDLVSNPQQPKYLNDEWLVRIMRELRQNQVACTYLMEPVAT